MKRLPKAEEDNELNLTPMLDVVFILLIFFIVTTSFVKETGIDVKKLCKTGDFISRALNRENRSKAGKAML